MHIGDAIIALQGQSVVGMHLPKLAILMREAASKSAEIDIRVLRFPLGHGYSQYPHLLNSPGRYQFVNEGPEHVLNRAWIIEDAGPAVAAALRHGAADNVLNRAWIEDAVAAAREAHVVQLEEQRRLQLQAAAVPPQPPLPNREQRAIQRRLLRDQLDQQRALRDQQDQ